MGVAWPARLRGFSMAEADIEAFYAQPWAATSSDGSIALPTDGPSGHARSYGTIRNATRALTRAGPAVASHWTR